uniref:UDP-glucose 4-epimerase family protein n=1 Tax=Marinobacterium profundum TaxID=1714300 RepID=UPI0009E769DC|nr:SDR family oxidoreductase [Marinobacterium profundum]
MLIDPISVLLTGSSGLVGGAIRDRVLELPAVRPILASRSLSGGRDEEQVLFDLEDSNIGTGLRAALDKTSVVIHCAARVHVIDDAAADPLTAFRAVNTAATLELAHAAAQAGVRRFIFLSSIKVNGESTPAGQPFTADDPCAPTDPYALSKWEAEQGLRRLSRDTGMEVVIIRPPLVYGPGVKANFRSLLKWIKRGAVFPLGSVDNQRSLVGLDNLVDLIITCIDHPGAANQTFLVSDNEDLSTPGLIECLSRAMGRSPRLLPCPVSLLRLGARLVGREDSLSRLCDSLQVNMSHTMDTLGWKPPVSVEDGIQKTVDDFMDRRFGGEPKQSYKEIRGEGAAPTGTAPTGCSRGKSRDA